MQRWEYTETELWQYGDKEYSIYHVFGLVAIKNVVLVFAEGRTIDWSDAGHAHDIVMRRSTDGGRSFGETVIVLREACWTNPVPVYDAQKKRLFLFCSVNYNNSRTENFVMHSDDLGVNWSQAVCVNPALEDGADPMPFHLAGPGHGIQLTCGKYAGRLIVPFWHRRYDTAKPAKEREYCISLLYSDDHGASWQHIDPFGFGCLANESRIVETQTELLWFIRPGEPDPRRFVSASCDGGLTWGEPGLQNCRPANNCDAGAISFCAKKVGKTRCCFPVSERESVDGIWRY